MSWYVSSNDGVHNKHKWGEGESRHIHRPVIIGHNGVKHSIVDYESHNSEQYMARTAKVVKYYRRFPGMADEEYIIPPRTEEYGLYRRFNSPPSKDHHRTTHGKSSNLNFDSDLTDDDDHDEDLSVKNTYGTRPNNMKEQEYHNDHEKNNSYGFPKEGSRPNHLRDQEDYYERVNPKTSGYSPPTYTVPISTRQDKEKGNDYATRARMGPFFGTPPRNETSYETSNFKPIANSPPQFNPQPKKEQGNYNQETIDSTEARRWHGMGAPGAGPGLYAEDKYSGGTINSKEAARRYNGVLLTN